MHNIHYLEVEEKADRNKILAHIEYHASHDGDGYCGKVKWHDNISPCKNREEAEKLISKLDNGWYDDHAVRYYDYSSAVTTKKIEELKAKRIEVIDKKMRICRSTPSRTSRPNISAVPTVGRNSPRSICEVTTAPFVELI